MQRSQIVALTIATSAIVFLALSHDDLHKLDLHSSSLYLRIFIAIAFGVVSNMFWRKRSKPKMPKGF